MTTSSKTDLGLSGRLLLAILSTLAGSMLSASAMANANLERLQLEDCKSQLKTTLPEFVSKYQLLEVYKDLDRAYKSLSEEDKADLKSVAPSLYYSLSRSEDSMQMRVAKRIYSKAIDANGLRQKWPDFEFGVAHRRGALSATRKGIPNYYPNSREEDSQGEIEMSYPALGLSSGTNIDPQLVIESSRFDVNTSLKGDAEAQPLLSMVDGLMRVAAMAMGKTVKSAHFYPAEEFLTPLSCRNRSVDARTLLSPESSSRSTYLGSAPKPAALTGDQTQNATADVPQRASSEAGSGK